MSEELTLKPCPCGKSPSYLCIEAQGDKPKWATASCNYCGEWRVEFRNGYADLHSDESRLAAESAWNNAPRALSAPAMAEERAERAEAENKRLRAALLDQEGGK